MGYYKNATICLNGHVASYNDANYRKYCKECGKETVSTCQNCHANIQGEYYVPGFIGPVRYDVPSYCHECGEPYPWTEKIIQNAIELVSLDDDLPIEHREIIKSTFPDLIVENPNTPVAVAKYKKYGQKASDFVQTGIRQILIDVVSDAVKKSIWG